VVNASLDSVSIDDYVVGIFSVSLG
ncbi:uncharacterized protein METZ01_LOCUS446443, partial [marine metagenome]